MENQFDIFAICDRRGLNAEAIRLNMQYIFIQYNAAKTEKDRNAWANLGMRELSELMKGSKANG